MTHPVATTDAVATSPVIFYLHTIHLGRLVLITRRSRKSMRRRWRAPRGATARPNALAQSRCRLQGFADPKHIGMSFAERQNRALRTNIRGATWLTNAFSKWLETHAFSVTLHSVHYNFADVHKTLRISPEMAAGIEDKLWPVADIMAMIDTAAKSNRRATQKIFLLVKAFKSIYLHGPPLMN